MPIDAGYLGYVLDQLSGLSEVVPKRTEAGVGLCFGGACFAVIDDALYLHADELSRAEFVARGMSALESNPLFYRVPDDVLRDVAQLTLWARRAVRAALAESRKRRPRRWTPPARNARG